MALHIRSGDGPAYTEELAAFLAHFDFDQLPAHVIHAARRGILDWVGCALAAHRHPTVEVLLSVLRENGGAAQASVLGRGLRLSRLDAAQANGQMGHLLDYDDTHMGGVILHASSPILAALLPLSQSMPVDGRSFIAAYIAGFEAGVRIGQAAPDHHAGGWHLTGTLGTFAAAAAAGRLLRLDARRMTHALGVAGTQAAGMQQNRGTMCKSFHAGRAAASGLMAALLAQRGFDSSEEIVEGKRGFARIYSRTADLERLRCGLGSDWMIAANGHKPYACGVVLHPAIDAALALRAQLAGDVDRVEHVALQVHPQVITITGTLTPTTGLHSKFSVYHSAAVALIDGAAGIAQYTDARAADPRVAALRERITVTSDDSLRRDQATAQASAGGHRLQARIAHATGTVENPMSDAAIEAKFRFNAAGALAPEAIDAVVADTWAFDQLTDVRAFADRLGAGQ
jgi:2-methylcitrate dehydratase PrpD